MKKKTLIILSILLLMSTFVGALPFSNFFKIQNIMIALDSASNKPLPDRYRNIQSLNISGSAQFTPQQIEPLKKVLDTPKICIVDLRQESHGFVNDIAISFYAHGEILNNGFTTVETIERENQELSRIKVGSNINIYHKTGRLFENVLVDTVSNEEEYVLKSGMEYKRFAVLDGGIPTPVTIDNFVEFIKKKPDDLHLHFHCDHGEGRTTTFMALYTIMNNEKNMNLAQILSYQYNMGGIILTFNHDREQFLTEFYNYVKENKTNNYSTPYSEWIKL